MAPDDAERLSQELHERAEGLERVARRFHAVASGLKAGADTARQRGESSFPLDVTLLELQGAARELGELAARPLTAVVR